MSEHKKIAHALVYDKNDLGIDEEIRKNLKVFYKRNLFIDHLKGNPPSAIIEDSADNCITNAAKQNYDFLILTWEGNVFNIYDFHLSVIDYIRNLEEKSQGNWLVAGHIIDQHKNRLLYQPKEAHHYIGSFFLFPITAIVNLKKWKEIGSPRWGATSENQKVIKPIPSEISIHDGYTPIELSASNIIVETKVKSGWNIINESLKNNINVYNLDNSIRKTQNYLYPENNVKLYNDFWSNLLDLPKLNDSYEKVFKFIVSCKSSNRIDKNNWSYFLRNTEEYFPRLKSNDLPDSLTIECIMSPCSGFKDFIISRSILDNFPIIIHYDILSPCVDIKKKIIQEWDGSRKGLEVLLTDIKNYYCKRDKDNCFHMNAMKSLSETYDELSPFFADEKEIQSSWKKFQNLKHFYFHLDILNDIDDNKSSLVKIIEDKSVYFCLSDVSGWRMNLLGYRVTNLRSEMIYAVKSLIKNQDMSIIDYKDPATDLHYLHTVNDAIKTLSSQYEI